MDSAPASTGQTGRVARVAMMRHFWADATPAAGFTPLPWKTRLLFVALAAGSFHVAYAFPPFAFVIVGWLYGLFRLSEVTTARQAFWIGVVAALVAYVPHVMWFWTIFKASAIALWMVLAFWIGLFVCVMRFARVRFGFKAACLLAPFVWTGFEFFRSELYPLRFSWLIPGFVAVEDGSWLVAMGGVYAIGFWLMALVMCLIDSNRGGMTGKVLISFGTLYVLVVLLVAQGDSRPTNRQLQVAAVQIEHDTDDNVLKALKHLRQKHLAAEVLVLSELAFLGPVPDSIRAWCKEERVHLIAGGKDIINARVFYNTVFIIGPDGTVVFKQAKTQPVQFMDDGLPAPHQRLWESPWGKIGLCICYDLSFTRVTDELIRRGAQALIVPTADEVYWGGYQHRLHARVAPVRAAEYKVPIFRVASSGISQLVDRRGRVEATAPFPGELETLGGTLQLVSRGSVPLDRYLVWPCVVIAFGLLGWHVFEGVRSRFNPQSAIHDPQ